MQRNKSALKTLVFSCFQKAEIKLWAHPKLLLIKHNKKVRFQVHPLNKCQFLWGKKLDPNQQRCIKNTWEAHFMTGKRPLWRIFKLKCNEQKNKILVFLFKKCNTIFLTKNLKFKIIFILAPTFLITLIFHILKI